MVGYETNRGIIPQATEEIFKRIEAKKGSGVSFEV